MSKSSTCQCNPGDEIGWIYVKLDQEERKSQKKLSEEDLKSKEYKNIRCKVSENLAY